MSRLQEIHDQILLASLRHRETANDYIPVLLYLDALIKNERESMKLVIELEFDETQLDIRPAEKQRARPKTKKFLYSDLTLRIANALYDIYGVGLGDFTINFEERKPNEH